MVCVNVPEEERLGVFKEENDFYCDAKMPVHI